VPCYLVERYLPDLFVEDIAAAVERLSTVSVEMSAEGIPIRFLSSVFIPGDEACMCQLEAPSSEIVRIANERAEFPFARIVPIEPIGAQRSGERRR
jgi:hypothetical protein